MKKKIVSDFVTTGSRRSDESPNHPERLAASRTSTAPGGLVMGAENQFDQSAKSSRGGTRWRWAIMAVCVLFGLLFAGVMLMRHTYRSDRTVTQNVPVVVPKVAEIPEVVSTHLLFVGDVFWGRAIETAAKSSGRGPANLFRSLKPEDKAPYDAWIGDQECPITDKDIPYRTQVDALVFNCRPEYTAEVSKWFDIMTLANNHTDNNGGVWGLEQTRAHLQQAGMQYFGNYDMGQEADICEVVTVKARSTLERSVSLPVAMCGFNYVGKGVPTQSQYDQMKRYAKLMPVIALPHMGVEYRATAESAKEEVFRALIDHGADLVVGDHPHVVQNSEVYKGKLIAYSVGNFLFDQQILGRDTTESLGVGVKLTFEDAKSIGAYTEVADSCRAYRDDCLTLLGQKLTKRPSITVGYDFQYFDESSGTPEKASEAVATLIRDRAGVDTLAGLATKWQEE